MNTWSVNGRRTGEIAADDRGLLYGDGLFETIAVRNGRPRSWSLHYARLCQGCAQLGIEPPRQSQLSSDLATALRASGNGTSEAVVKIIVTTGSGPRGYQRPEPAQTSVLIQVTEYRPLPRSYYTDGVRIVACKTPVTQQPHLAGIKTLNRLDQVLARNEFRDPGLFEGLMFDPDDRLICGTMSNVFIVQENEISTPSLDRCGVAGIMRAQVIECAAMTRVSCRVRDIGRSELARADEIFLANSQFGLLPVASFYDQSWPVGPITRQFMQILADSGVVECAV
jgi:4-amino-4-deoxychorismate lyase